MKRTSAYMPNYPLLSLKRRWWGRGGWTAQTVSFTRCWKTVILRKVGVAPFGRRIIMVISGVVCVMA